MERVLKARSDIYDHFQRSAVRDHFLNVGNEDAFAQYDVAMCLIQDTAEGIWAHREKGFSHDPLVAYIEFWGVMQAVAIQQDALGQLQLSLMGEKSGSTGPAWDDIRRLRNIAAGHPAKKSVGELGPLRSFMGRQTKTYQHITYELWDAASQKTTFPVVNLGQLIDAYDREASYRLETILLHMRQVWP